MTNKIITLIIISLLISSNYCCASDSVKKLVPEAEKIVLAGLNNSDIAIKDNVIEVIAAGQITDMMPKVVALLDDPAVAVRFTAAVAIGDMQYKQAEKKLKKMLKDPDLNVAIAACYALYKIDNDEKDLKSIEDFASNSSQLLQANVAMLLGKLKNQSSLHILYKLKDNPSSSDAVAYNATEAIARIGDIKIYQKIWALLISVYVDDRCMGVQAMGALGGGKGKNALLTMLDDAEPQVRLIAAGQLGELGDKSGQSVVLTYLNSAPPAEKSIAERRNVLAAMAIGQIGSEELTAHLSKLLNNESSFVRLAAVRSVFLLAKPR
jgi:HEAT repeat protein